MVTLGLPYFFEDTTGEASGPTDFLDIYDRPPYLHLDNATRNPRPNQESRSEVSATLAIFELGGPIFARSHKDHKPSAVLAFDHGWSGTVKFRSERNITMGKWLKKSSAFGSTFTRQFKGSNGMYYEWSYRGGQGHEWTCIQVGSGYLVAHYDLRSILEPRYETSGNVLTVYETWVHLAVELLASLVIMRYIHATTMSPP